MYEANIVENAAWVLSADAVRFISVRVRDHCCQQRRGPCTIALVLALSRAAAERVRLDEHGLRAAGIARFNISP
jgi:hypothetical protein